MRGSPSVLSLSVLVSVSSIVIYLLFRTLSTESQELLEGHNLVVKLDLRLRKDSVTHLWVICVFGQLSDFLGDCCDFGTVVMLNE